MGFSTTAAFAILFIAGLIALSVLSATVITEVREINTLMKARTKYDVDIRTSDFKIVNVTAQNVTSTTYNLTVIIENTGSTTFNCTEFTLLVDGNIIDFTSNVTLLYPLQYAKFYNSSLPGTVGSTHRLKIVSDNGIEKYATFTVR